MSDMAPEASGDNKETPAKRTIVDMEFFKDLTMGDYEFEKDLLMIFKDSALKNIQKLEEAVQADDSKSWVLACHAFKGGANAIGAVDLSKMLEHGQKNPSETLDQKKELLKKAKIEFEVVSKFLASEIERSLMF